MHKKHIINPNQRVIKVLYTAFTISTTFTLLLMVWYATLIKRFDIESTYINLWQAPIGNPANLYEVECEFEGPLEDVAINELDPESCGKVSRYFIVDKFKVYKQLYIPGGAVLSQYKIIEEADPKTFQLQNFGYFRDERRLFFDAGKKYLIVEKIDLDSVEILSMHFLRDKDGVYIFKPDVSENLVVLDVDTKSFEILSGDPTNEYYFKDSQGIYFNKEISSTHSLPQLINDVDKNSFEILEFPLMAKDKNHIYYEGNVLEEAEVKTFKLLGFSNSNDWLGYSKDKNTVFYYGKVVDGVDVKSFAVRGNRAFDKDFEFAGTFRID